MSAHTSTLADLTQALAFLTRVAVPVRGEFDLARAAWAFPVVGAGIGLGLGSMGVLLADRIGILVAAVLVVVLEVLLTGALHLDGLADSADGTGGRDRDARLRIMKDHSVGVYGVAAVVLDLMLKAALVAGVLAAGWAGPLLLGVAYALSRGMMLPLAGLLPYARHEGTGRALVQGLTRSRLLSSVAMTLGVVVLLIGLSVWVAGWHLALTGAGMVAAAAVGAAIISLWARRTLDGVTGDVLGAAAEVTLLLALLALAAW